MTEPDVAAIAAGLTNAQRAALVTVPNGWFNVPSFGTWGDLLSKRGLFRRYHHIYSRRFSATASPLGLAVRNHLQSEAKP